jgi:hypothetical protein
LLVPLFMAGSGCTTLLKVLAGYDAGFEEIEGEVKFGDIPMDVMKKRYRGEVAFNGAFVVSAALDDSPARQTHVILRKQPKRMYICLH